MAFNTGNPIGSTSPRDLSDNAENFDRFANGNAAAYDDRLGVSRKSISGMESEFASDQSERATTFANFLASSGYVGTGTGGAIEDYAGGIQITAYNQIIRESGEFYRAKASLSLPYTTTGTWVGDDETRFVSVGDAALRQEIGSGIFRANSLATLESTPGRFDGDAARLVSGTGRDGDFRWDSSDLSATLVLASATSDSVDDTTDTINDADHPFSDGDGVITQATVNGLTAHTVYWVVNSTAGTYQLSATFGGGAVDLTGTTNVTIEQLLDPRQAVWVTPSSDKTGAAGAWARRDFVEVLPEFAEAAGDGSSDDIGPLAAVTALSKALDVPLALSKSYGVSDAYSYEGFVNSTLICRGKAEIVRLNKSGPAMRLSGRLVNQTGILTVRYSSAVSLTISDTDAVGILFTGLARSNFESLNVRHVGLGIKIDQNTGFGYTSQNALFSCTFNFLDISDVSYAFFDLRSFGGSTGNNFVNFYMTNNVEGVVQPCDRFGWIGTFSENEFGQINFERAECRHLVTVSSDVDLLNFGGVHVEAVKTNAAGEGEGYFYLNNDTIVNIDSLSIVGAEIDGAVAANYTLFRLGDDAKVNVGGISERDATITNSPNLRFVRYSGAGITTSRVTVNNIAVSDFQALEFGTPQGMAPALIVDRVYPLDGVLITGDNSVSWSPQVTERTVIFSGLTTGRSFTVNEARRFDGAEVLIKNDDPTFNVGVTANGVSDTLTPGQSTRLVCDGTNWVQI